MEASLGNEQPGQVEALNSYLHLITKWQRHVFISTGTYSNPVTEKGLSPGKQQPLQISVVSLPKHFTHKSSTGIKNSDVTGYRI